jgi:hypothetical protein
MAGAFQPNAFQNDAFQVEVVAPIVTVRRGGIDERQDIWRRELEWERDLKLVIDQAWAIAHGLMDPVTLEPIPPPDLEGLATALELIEQARDRAAADIVMEAEARRQEEEAIAILLLAA